MIEGMIIGGIGTVFGVVTGLAVCTGLSWFGLRLDPEVYYIDRLPVSVTEGTMWPWPSWRCPSAPFRQAVPGLAASMLRPVDGSRWE